MGLHAFPQLGVARNGGASRPLKRAVGEHGRAVLLPVSTAFVGNTDPGVTWTCPRCGTALVVGVHERQFLNLFVRCSRCQTLGGLPSRSPGEPMPAGSVKMPPGRYLLGTPVDVVDKPIVTAGQSAFDGYARETGADYAGQSASTPRSAQLLDASRLRSIASQAKRLLGPYYKSLAEADTLGLKSKTPPPRRHRLMDLIRYSELAANQLAAQRGGDTVTLDGDALTELMAALAFFRRWRHHPVWPRLRDSLANPDEVQHSVMTLGVASLLVDTGNGVGLVDHVGAAGRVPDLWLVPRIAECLEVEVKTPLVLRAPGPDGINADAIGLLTRLIDEAAGTRGGQLNPALSGLVAIGSFHLGEKGLDRIADVAKQVLDRQSRAKRKPHLIAVVVFEVTYQLTTMLDEKGNAVSTSATPAINHRMVFHPGYEGTLSIGHKTPW